jgi:hypothetical protein
VAAFGAGDHAPRIVSIRLTPLDPTRTATVTAKVTARDPDGTRVRLTYRWLRNGKAVAGATGRSLDLARHGIHKGNRVAVRVTARDGVRSVTETSSALVVRDAAPRTSSLSIDPTAPTAADTLTATLVASDPDHDPLTEQRTWSWTCPEAPSGTAVATSLDLSAHDVGPGCVVGLSDSVSDGQLSAVASASAVTVVDRPPTVGAVVLSPAQPTADQVVTASATASDPDGDHVGTSCAWTVGGSPVATTACSIDLATVGATKGEVVSVTLTASDGTLGSLADASTTIADAAPVIGSVGIDASSPATNDTIHASVDLSDSDGDPLSLAYQWLVNGQPVAGATGPALDLSQTGNGDRGDAITVSVTSSDGTAEATATSTAVTVVNTAPVLDTAALSTNQPIAGQMIAVAPVSATDADGDPVTTSVAWSLDGVDLGIGDQVSVPATAVRGDTIRATVSATDGTDTTSQVVEEPVADAPPVVGSASIDAASPATDDTIHAVVDATDPDGDPLTLSYQWLLNDVPLTGATDASLDLSVPGHGDRGDLITVVVTADDRAAKAAVTSDPVTIHNASPVLAHALIHYHPDTATATVGVAATDLDGDAVATSVRWTIDGVDAGSAGTLELAAAGAHAGDQIGARVWVTDSQGTESTWVTAVVVVISSGVPVAPPMNAWHPLNGGYGGPVDAILPESSLPGGLYAFEALGFHHSTDGGTTWTDSLGQPCAPAESAALDPSDPSIVYVGCSSNGLYRSNDGGSTWQHLPLTIDGVNRPSVMAIAVDPTAPDTLFAAAQESPTDVYRSRDGGQTWQAVDTAVRFGLSVAIDPNDAQHVIVGTNQGVIVSNDGGDTWSGPFGPGMMKAAFDPGDPSRIWAIRYDVAGASVLSSPDGGTTWTTVPGSPAHLVALAAAPSAVDVGGTNGVSQSTDGGASWITTSTGYAGHVSALAADQTDRGRVYVGVDRGTVWELDFAPGMAQGATPYTAIRLDGVTNIQPTSATFNATLAPLFTGDYGWVAWDFGVASLNMVAPLVAITGTNAAQPITTTVTGLIPDTTYHLRLGVALNAWNHLSAYSGTYQVTFTTPPATGGSMPVDAAPVIDSVAVQEQDPDATTVLHANVEASDADGDPLALSYQWMLNGAPISGATGASLDLSVPGHGDRGDLITVMVTADDGTAQTDASSSAVTIANAAPQMASATVQYDPATGTATVLPAVTDADGDTISTSVVWTINGRDAGSDPTIDLAQAGATIGDVIGARVQASDGITTTDWVIAAPVTIDTGPASLVASPLMPWALMRGTYTVGGADIISTNGSSVDNGPISPPYVSGSTCSVPSGANLYANEISGALIVCPIAIGQVIDTKTGNNAGPTAQGLDARIASYQPVDQIAQSTDAGGYIITAPASPQLVRIPVVLNQSGGTAWPGSGQLHVVGYAWGVITGYTAFGAQVDVTIVASTD